MLANIFGNCYKFLRSWPRLTYSLYFGTLALCIYLASCLHFTNDVQGVLPNSEALKAMNDVATQSKAGDQILFILKGADDTGLMAAADALSSALEEHASGYLTQIQTQPGNNVEQDLLPIIEHNLPLLLQPDDYDGLDALLTQEALNNRLAQSKKILMSPVSVVYKNLVANDPIGLSNTIWQRLTALNFDPNFESRDGYLFADSGKALIMSATTVHPANATGKNKGLSQQLNKIIKEVAAQQSGVKIQAYGGSLIAAGNANQMQRDTILTLSITVFLLLLVTIYYFHSVKAPLLIFLPVVYGAAFGLAMVYLTQGSIAMMALGAGAIVLGVAVDFSIHFLAEVRRSKSVFEAVLALSKPLTLGSITTVLAFYILRFAETPVLKDFGLFASYSLIGSALATLIFLPHFISKNNEASFKPNLFDKMGTWRPERNKWLVLGICLLTPFFLYWSFKVKFDSDMMHLNYLSPQMQQSEKTVLKLSPGIVNSVYVLAQGNTPDKALDLLQSITPQLTQWQKNGTITALSNPALFMASSDAQKEKMKQWHQFWTSEKIQQVKDRVAIAAANNGFNKEAFNNFFLTLTQPPTSFTTADKKVLQQLFPGGFAQNGQAYYAIAALKVPETNRQHVLQAFSDRRNIQVADKRLGAQQLTELLNVDFNRIAIYSSLIVFLALLIAYGRIELALFSFVPMVISWIWILGFMALVGIEFNIVNIIISTLIFGLGDDYSIFTMDGLIEKYKFQHEKLSGVRSAIYVSATTTIIGLGVLVLAKHPALKSIAVISVPGMLCVLIISQTLQPFLFNWFIQNRAYKRFMPFTLRSFCISVFAFTYFFVGSMLLTLLGVLFTVIWPFNKNRGKYYLHVCLSKFTWSMMYIMGNVKKRIIRHGNPQSYDQPALYIANHSSFLDILITTMLTPKMILLTNRWVWKSAVFGKVVKMAEYYPVADGVEDSIEPLKEIVKRGYSIMVFPEGTRSYTDKIHRFKKGAFYIAEQLKLNIVPIVLHGVHYTMQKGDWLLKDGTCNIHIYEPMVHGNNIWGLNYSQQAKSANNWMRQELNAIKIKSETPGYFREQLINSYLYKGPILEWYCKIKSKLEGNYERFHELLPRTGTIYDLGCGYGFLSYMLHWSAPERKLIGVDYDEEKIATAHSNYLRDHMMEFHCADLSQFVLKPCDAIVITDVLHYLIPDEQKALLDKCAQAVAAGGTIIIRDGVVELKDKIKGTKLTEIFSTKIFKFNKTNNPLYFISRDALMAWAGENGFSCRIIDETTLTSNLIFVLNKN